MGLLPIALAGALLAPPNELKYDLPIDGAVAYTTTSLFVATEIVKEDLAPSHCRWCDDALNPLDENGRRLRWENVRLAARISDVLLLGVSPALGYGGLALAGAAETRGVDAVLMTESVGVTLLLMQTAKLIAARRRPFIRAGSMEVSADDRMSFFSGHTATTTAFGTSAAMLASMRGYALAPALWAVGLSVPIITAYFRIAADRHYLTDVMTGFIVGSACGILLPLIFHPISGKVDQPAPSAASSAPLITFGGGF